MLLPKLASTTLLTEPPKAMGLAAKSTLAKVTLSAVPGAPAADQFPPDDQSVSPAKPLHDFDAPEAEVAVASTPERTAPVMRSWCSILIWRTLKTASRS